MRSQTPLALGDCVDPAKFVLEAISKEFLVDNRVEKSDRGSAMESGCKGKNRRDGVGRR
ncbi:FRIGIDA-like protein 4a [Pyrus ussuriensis x Pyrus communis]|uniref:FRIGIDA-like protein 4a n=1 Tax=Pyrus ussuriensis x Pyrus communis TaxID=2448454 RepID=A0A5N5FJF8_9ROSA|nr:FRIGIDA-like protein 4a [Pyrus ussuriensis x Pyrus communis]